MEPGTEARTLGSCDRPSLTRASLLSTPLASPLLPRVHAKSFSENITESRGLQLQQGQRQERECRLQCPPLTPALLPSPHTPTPHPSAPALTTGLLPVTTA